MTFSRLFQCGFEFGDIDELTEYLGYGNSSATISTSGVNTGTYHLNITSGAYPRGKSISGTSTVCLQSGLYFRHDGTNTGDTGIIYFINGTKEIHLTMDEDDDLVRLVVDGSVEDSLSLSNFGISSTDTYYAIGIYAFANATTGRVGIYLNGELKLEFDGDTGTYFTGVYAGGDYTGSSNAFASFAYVDDFWCDTSTIEETESPPEVYTFDFIAPNGDGGTLEWSTSGSATHYLNIDDYNPPDEDTTYNYVTADSLVDIISLEDYSIPSNLEVTALIPTVYVRKTSAGSEPEIDIGLNENSTDEYASGQTVTTAYAYKWAKFDAAPDTDGWDDTNIDATSLLLRSGGTF